MYDADEQAFDRDDLFEEVTISNVADFRQMRQKCSVAFVIRHPDVPEGISIGTVTVEGTLRQFLEAIAAGISAIICDMEAGVSKEGCATLPSVDLRDSVPQSAVAKSCVVRGREER